MSSSQDLPEKFHLNYTHGKCLGCDGNSGNKPFCESCERGFNGVNDIQTTVQQPVQQTHQHSAFTVNDLPYGNVGYVHFLAFFTENDFYHVYLNAIVESECKSQFYLKIRKSSDGVIYLDAQSIGSNEIPPFQLNKYRRADVRVRLENTVFTPRYDPEFPLPTIIKTLEDKQVGYVSPKAFISCDGFLWVDQYTFVLSEAENEHTVKIRKQDGLIEVDSNTIPDDKLIDQPWPEDEPFSDYMLAILINTLP